MKIRFSRADNLAILATMLGLWSVVLVGATVGFGSCGGGCGDEVGPGVPDGGADALGAPVELERVPTEADVATKFARSDGGKVVRVVGQHELDEVGTVEDTAAGRGVEVTELDPNALCHVIVEARIKAKSEAGEDGKVYVGNVPDMPEYEDAFGIASWPVLLSGSCTPQGVCYWSALFKGEDCLRVADSPYYIGSSMAEFIGLPVDRKARLLRLRGVCDGEPCTVPFGDARAVAGARARVMHGWSGRDDLNFVGAVDGADADSRYEVPK